MEEEYLTLPAASGRLVRVPKSRLKEWQAEQEKLKDPAYRAKQQEEIRAYIEKYSRRK